MEVRETRTVGSAKVVNKMRYPMPRQQLAYDTKDLWSYNLSTNIQLGGNADGSPSWAL